MRVKKATYATPSSIFWSISEINMVQDDSDISSSYTPMPTRTKSGRNVNKPVAFVPTIPEPSQTVKRRRSTKTILAAQCKICHRGTDPGNNRIVFCDVCSTPYHQYCHNPPIENEVVNVLEKEWLCGPCQRSKESVVENTDGLVATEGLSIEDVRMNESVSNQANIFQKRAYFSSLPQSRLVSLLLHASIRHPELPLFPPNVEGLIPAQPAASTASKPSLPTSAPQAASKQLASLAWPMTSPPNGHGPIHSHPSIPSAALVDPAEAQLLGEDRQSNIAGPSQPAAAVDLNGALEQGDEYDDGYDTDPPAHYPKAGNGLARTLPPESEDLNWLVDDNFEVFSHGWKGDGSGLGADGVLSEGMEGMENGKA